MQQLDTPGRRTSNVISSAPSSAAITVAHPASADDGRRQGRRHGVDWGGHVPPLLPEGVSGIDAVPLSYFRGGEGVGVD